MIVSYPVDPKSRLTVAGATLCCTLMLVLTACTTPLTLPKTEPEKPDLLMGSPRRVSKLIFLSSKEASCPTQCSSVMSSDVSYSRFVSHIEKRLTQRGYRLVSGAIVSRVEDRLMESQEREKWDRTEKALLLGKDTGADAIFEVRSLYIDKTNKTFLLEQGDANFSEVPSAYAAQIVREESGATMFEVPIWEASVEIRMMDMDGNVIWSGAKLIRTTDVIPEDWKVELKKGNPRSRVARSMGGKKKENYDYARYFLDEELQKDRVFLIIDDLINQLPDSI